MEVLDVAVARTDHNVVVGDGFFLQHLADGGVGDGDLDGVGHGTPPALRVGKVLRRRLAGGEGGRKYVDPALNIFDVPRSDQVCHAQPSIGFAHGSAKLAGKCQSITLHLANLLLASCGGGGKRLFLCGGGVAVYSIDERSVPATLAQPKAAPSGFALHMEQQAAGLMRPLLKTCQPRRVIPLHTVLLGQLCRLRVEIDGNSGLILEFGEGAFICAQDPGPPVMNFHPRDWCLRTDLGLRHCRLPGPHG